MLSDIRNFENLNEDKQIEILNDCINELKDDDINKTILINKINSIKSSSKTSYKKIEFKTFKVN